MIRWIKDKDDKDDDDDDDSIFAQNTRQFVHYLYGCVCVSVCAVCLCYKHKIYPLVISSAVVWYRDLYELTN